MNEGLKIYEAFVEKVFSMMDKLYEKDYNKITYTVVTVLFIHGAFYIFPIILLVGKYLTSRLFFEDKIVWVFSMLLTVIFVWFHFRRYPNVKEAKKHFRKKRVLPTSLSVIVFFTLSIASFLLWKFARSKF